MTTYLIKNNDGSKYLHYTGGKINYDGDISCPICNNTLYNIFSYDIADTRIPFPNWPTLYVPLLFCMNCEMFEIQYCLNSGNIKILKYDGVDYENNKMRETETPYINLDIEAVPNEIIDILDKIENDTISNSDDDKLTAWSKYNFGRNGPPFPHVGKPKFIIGGLYEEKCLVCDKIMETVAALYDTLDLKFDYLDVCCQYVFSVCKNCNTVHGCIHQS